MIELETLNGRQMRIVARRLENGLVLAVTGELDLTTAPVLERELLRAEKSGLTSPMVRSVPRAGMPHSLEGLLPLPPASAHPWPAVDRQSLSRRRASRPREHLGHGGARLTRDGQTW
jgi:hypothetical protein